MKMSELNISDAIRSRDYALLQRLLDEGYDPNTWISRKEDEIRTGKHVDVGESYTLLQLAVTKKDKKAVDILISAGADPNLAMKHGSMPIQIACKRHERSDHDCVMALLVGGADVNVGASGKADNPLDAAVFNRDRKLVEILLEHGASPHVSSISGEMPLSHIENDMHIDIARMLIDKGANPFMSEKNATSPFIMVAGNDDATACLNLYIEQVSGKRQDDEGKRKESFFKLPDQFKLLKKAFKDSVKLDCAEHIEILLDLAVQMGVDEALLSDSKLFDIAIKKDHWDVLELLLSRTSMPEDGSFKLIEPVANAISHGDYWAVRMFMKSAAMPVNEVCNLMVYLIDVPYCWICTSITN